MQRAKGARVAWPALRGFCLSAVVGIGLLPATATAQSNPIVIENQQPGTNLWQIPWGSAGTDVEGQIKGYASATSVNKGDTITFNVSVNPAQTFTIDVYRMGWYQGLGGRLMRHIGPLDGTPQPTCPADATTGLIECNWAPTYVLATQTSWTSGIYIARMTNAAGYQNYIMFVLRDDNRVAPLLYQQGVMTYQAYNDYPYDGTTGKSLYAFNSYGAPTVTGGLNAAKVSFDRPYMGDGTAKDWGNSVFTWEIAFVRWMEKSGYDVTYSTDIDTHANGVRLLNYSGIVSLAHDEYWSKEMYDAFLAARDAGVNLAFFGADAADWQARLEPSSSGVPNRVLVCYRDATIDPITDPSLKTVNWSDPPLNRPEQTLIGVQYTHAVLPQPQSTYGGNAPYVVTNSGNWVYAGTGFKNGDSVPGIVGYEADRSFSQFSLPNAVSGTYFLLSHSPFVSNAGPSDYSNSSIYQAPSGAWVFGAGTMSWSWGLDNFNGYNTADPRIQIATANILSRLAYPKSDFTMAASPATRTTTQGGSRNYTITITPTGALTGDVTLSVSGLPPGATFTFTPNPATATSTLAVKTSASTPTGTYKLTITGANATVTHVDTVSLQVTDFTVAASPSNQTVLPGGSTDYGVTISSTSGFTGSVNLSVSGLPTDATGVFAPNPATAAVSTLTVTTGATTPPGIYTLTITGINAPMRRTATVTLVVTTTDFTLAASPPSQTVLQGGSTNYGVAINATGGFSGPVDLSVSGLPAGASGSFTPTPATASSVLSVTADASTPLGTYSLTITGVSGTLTHVTTVSLVVSIPDFALSASPSSQTVLAGGSTGYGVTISETNGFSDPVSLSVSGLPSGASGSFALNPATFSSTLAVTTDASTPPGTYPLTITGVSGTLAHITTVSLVVNAPDFTIAASLASQTVRQGGSLSYSVTIGPTNGFVGQVSLGVSGLPSGASGSFTPNPALLSSTLAVTTGASTPPGTYVLTITAVSGVLTHATAVSLTVAPVGVTYDNTVSSGFQWGVASATTPAFVIGGGTDRAAMIMVAMSGTGATNITASLGGVSGTAVPGTDSGTTASIRTLIFQVINPPSGAQTATVSWAGGTFNVDVGVITVSGADQTTPVTNGTFAAITSTPTATTSITIASNLGDLTASISYTADAWVTPFTNQTLKWGVDSAAVAGDIGPGTGPTTHTWTDTYAFQTHAVSGANFKAAPNTSPAFTLSASPASQAVLPGGSANYDLTISATGGFSGPVSLSVSGLPAGASGSFTVNPATASSALAVTTDASTPLGTYPLTITGVGGTLTHTTTVSLVVSTPDFTIAASPASQTVKQGGSVNYGVTIGPMAGFVGQVSLSVSGLPSGASGSFAPNPALLSSTLAVTTGASTPPGTYVLTITGVSGVLAHATAVSLTVAPVGVTYDNTVSSGFQWGVASATTPAFVIGSGTDRAAMIMVAMSGTGATNITASLGGVSGTVVPGTDSGTTASIRTLIFQVINPPSGAQTATVSWAGGTFNVDVGVITVSGADQTTPVTNGTFAATTSTPTATTSITIASNLGDLTASIGYTADAWVTPFTNQTLKWGVDSAAVAGDIGPGTGPTTHTWTDTYAFQTHAVSGANFKTSTTP